MTTEDTGYTPHGDKDPFKEFDIDVANVLDVFKAGVIGIHTDGTFFHINAYGEQLFGWEKNEVVGRHLFDFAPYFLPEGQTRTLLDEIIAEGKTWEDEMSIKTKEGKSIIISLLFSPVYDVRENLAGTLIIARDITEQKAQEQQALRELEIIEATSDFIGMANPQGEVFYLNRHGKEMVGMDPDDDVSNTRVEDYSPEWATNIIKDEGIPTAMEEGIWEGETAFVHRDGTEIPVLQVIMAHKNEDGEITHVSTIARNITHVKEAQEELRQRTWELSREKATDEAILLSIGEGLVVTDNEAHITFVNKRFSELTGWGQDEVINRDIVEAIPMRNEEGQEVPYKEQILSRFFASKETIVAEDIYYIKSKEGQIFPVSITVSPILVDGNMIGAVQVFRDITDEMEIDKAKSEFVSLASHQLRTPLSTINWYAEMLINGDMGELSEDQAEFLNEIYRSNQRMIDLVNALLNVSRIELGTLAVEPEPLDITEIAQQSLKDLEALRAKRDLTITEEYDENLPKLKADKRLLLVIFQNLFSNAIKYTPDEGEITIRITTEDDGDICISVSDSGYGIPKKEQSKIFTKLFRADNVQRRDTDGTGLGLYITKAIVEMAGGRIHFDSAEGEGTTFYVRMPKEGMERQEGQKELVFTELSPGESSEVNL